MKTRLSIVTLSVLVASLLGTACSDDKDKDGAGNVPASGKIVVTLDGKKTEFSGFYIAQSSGTVSNATAVGTNPGGTELKSATVSINSTNGSITADDYEMLAVAVTGNSSLTKYAIVAFATANTNTSEVWLATEGTVTVTKITDTELQGTFSGKVAKMTNEEVDLENKKNFSGGFNVKKL